MYRVLFFLLFAGCLSCQQRDAHIEDSLKKFAQEAALTKQILSDLDEQTQTLQSYYQGSMSDSSLTEKEKDSQQRRKKLISSFITKKEQSDSVAAAVLSLQMAYKDGLMKDQATQEKIDSLRGVHNNLREAAMRYPDMLARMKRELGIP